MVKENNNIVSSQTIPTSYIDFGNIKNVRDISPADIKKLSDIFNYELNKKKKEFIDCPQCRACVSVINGKISRHERGLGYTPYSLYHNLERFGTPVKQQAKTNKCDASGKFLKEIE